MTDKQIIIDGVDVSECIFHSLTTMGYAGYNYCKCFECVCKCHNDCYYKQLKCKEQECEGIKKQLDRFKTENKKLKDKAYILFDEAIIERDNFIEELKAEKEQAEQEREALQMSDNEAREIVAELKAECKELKEKVKELNQGWIDCDKERNLQEANSEFRQRVINRYKQTLTEIKEIAKPYCNACSEFWRGKGRHCKYCNYSKILQKISEVLDDGTKQS